MSLESVYARVSSPFGASGEMWQTGHGGADYAADAGDPVMAYEPGVIRYTASSGWGGGLVGMDLDSGEFAGWAHIDPIWVAPGQRVKPGDIIGLVAGFNGNHGYQWTGPHIHTTRSRLSAKAAATGARPLIDPAPGIAAALQASGDEMTPEQAQQLSAVYAAIFGPANVDAGEVSWKNPTGTQTAQYGLLPIVIHNQTLIAQLIGQVSALASAAGVGGADLKALEAAAEKGARDALAELTLKATA